MKTAQLLTKAARDLQAIADHDARQHAVDEAIHTMLGEHRPDYAGAEWHHYTDADGQNQVSYNVDSAAVFIYQDRTPPHMHRRPRATIIYLTFNESPRIESADIPFPIRLMLADLDRRLNGVITANLSTIADDDPAAASLLAFMIERNPNQVTAALFQLWQSTAEQLDALRSETRARLEEAVTTYDYAQSFGWHDRAADAWTPVRTALNHLSA